MRGGGGGLQLGVQTAIYVLPLKITKLAWEVILNLYNNSFFFSYKSFLHSMFHNFNEQSYYKTGLEKRRSSLDLIFLFSTLFGIKGFNYKTEPSVDSIQRLCDICNFNLPSLLCKEIRILTSTKLSMETRTQVLELGPRNGSLLWFGLV